MRLYDYQSKVAQAVREGRSIILQAPTGAGKTLASLWPFLEQWELEQAKVPKKCIYAVPMRVLANQFIYEYRDMVNRRLLLEDPPNVRIQTGERPEDQEFEGDLTFATIDQVLSSWLMHPYSLPRRLGNLNAGTLVASYLVFDEFHLFDPDSMLPTTLHMLKTLKGISPFVLMTATFSAEMLQKLADLLDAEPILLTDHQLQGIGAQKKVRRYFVREQPLVAEEVAQSEFVLETHRTQPGNHKRSIVIFNQVERAQRFYKALLGRVGTGTKVRLLHSRFRQEDRKLVEDEIRREFGKEKDAYVHESMILVATQVIEVGLDATCQALHTELAPAASVLQRAGRCARYEGEEGSVYVHAVESSAPYFGEAEAQSKRTCEWLRENQDRHLTFEDEQALINHAHTPTDRKILMQLEAGAFGRREAIRALWRGEGGRAEAQRLIRNIQSQSLLVHSDPDRLLDDPFSAEMFSIHPGTVQGKFERWQEEAQEDFAREPLPWAVCRLVEVETDEEASRPVEYRWKPAKDKTELWGAPLLAVHPVLVGYREDLGLTLFSGTWYECDVPGEKQTGSWQVFYRLETYEEHIRLVHEAFVEDEERVQTATDRVERALDWRPGLLSDAAHLVVWLHDLGKLSTGWQKWASMWQQRIGHPHSASTALAHTDYDSRKEQHRQLDKKLGGKRPPHAVESALAAVPFLLKLLDGEINHPVLRAAFTAIARHHAPYSRHSEGYVLVPGCVPELERTLNLLPKSLRELVGTVPESDQFAMRLDVQSLPGSDFIRERLLIDERIPADMCAYMLLVRVLRRADQEGTKRGATAPRKE